MRVHRAHAAYATAGGDDNALILRHTTLIDRLARRMSLRVGDPALFDDLWSAGALGLLDAARRFDVAQAVRFETFAEHRIRGAMLDELRRLDHLPRRLRSDVEKVAAAKKELEGELGRDPEAEEVAERLGMDLETLAEMELLQQPVMPMPDDLPVASAEMPVDEALFRHQRQALVEEAVGGLPERLQLLLQLHYVEGLTYKEIAGIFKVSEPRICQLHKDAMGRLRGKLSDVGIEG